MSKIRFPGESPSSGGHACSASAWTTCARAQQRIIDAADAERRRIERDLHDGAQQRLVSVAVTLGTGRGAGRERPVAARRG